MHAILIIGNNLEICTLTATLKWKPVLNHWVPLHKQISVILSFGFLNKQGYLLAYNHSSYSSTHSRPLKKKILDWFNCRSTSESSLFYPDVYQHQWWCFMRLECVIDDFHWCFGAILGPRIAMFKCLGSSKS